MQCIHEAIYKFFTGYGYALCMISILLLSSIYAVFANDEVPSSLPEKSLTLLHQELEGNTINAAYELAHLYADGKTVPQDKQKATDLFRYVVLSYLPTTNFGKECAKEFDIEVQSNKPYFPAKHPLHLEQVRWAQSLCYEENETLYKIGQSYMETEDPNWHAVIAFQIFSNLKRSFKPAFDAEIKAMKKGWPDLYD